MRDAPPNQLLPFLEYFVPAAICSILQFHLNVRKQLVRIPFLGVAIANVARLLELDCNEPVASIVASGENHPNKVVSSAIAHGSENLLSLLARNKSKLIRQLKRGLIYKWHC